MANEDIKKNILKISLLILLIIFFRSLIFPVLTWKKDEFFYLTAAKEINAGGFPYRDFADIKPAGIYYIYALADKLAGGDVKTDFFVLRIFSVSAVFLISLFLWIIGKKLFDEKSGYGAALIFAVYSTCVRGSEVLPANTELFSSLFLVVSIFFFCRSRDLFKIYDLAAASFFLSLSFLVNQRSGIAAVVYVLILFIFSENKKAAFLKTLFSAFIFLLPLFALILFYYLNGALEDFLNWQYFFTKYYIGAYSLPARIFRGVLVYRFFAGLLPLLFFSGYLLIVGKERRKKREYIFLSLLLLFLWLSAFSGGKHVERYYFQLFIPLSLLSAAGLELFISIPREKAVLAMTAVFFAISPIIYFHMNLISVHLDKNPMSYDAYLNDKKEVIKYIEDTTGKDDKIFVWPFGDVFYFCSDRKMAVPIYDPSGHLLGSGYLKTEERAKKIYGWFFERFEKTPPEVIIDSTGFFGTEGRKVNKYISAELEKLRTLIKENYTKIGKFEGGYSVYRKN